MNHGSDKNQGNPTILQIKVQTKIKVILQIKIQTKSKFRQ